MSTPDRPEVDDLATVRDWLRYGISTFTRARLVYGHGTSTALDEAAFLILASLHLPIDQLEPWLDAHLTRAERTVLADLFARRIETRKPAPYLVNAAYMLGHRFYVDERVIVPRSYIGELLADRLSALVDPDAVTRVLDVCTGSGCLAILAALAFPDAQVDAVELSADAIEVARRNVADYALEERVSLYRSDLFAALPAGTRYDVVIANPPYVARAEVDAFDPEYRAEPVMAHLGGDDGLDLVRRILAEVPRYLEPNGWLVMEIGTGRERIEEAYPDLEILWLDTETSEGEVMAVSAAALGVDVMDGDA